MSDMDEKIEKIMERLGKLEKVVFAEEKPKIHEEKVYKGLIGGIQFLFDNEFFNEPKGLRDVIDKLKQEGYHYGTAPVAKALSVGFTNKKKILTRFKEGKNYKYVIRK